MDRDKFRKAISRIQWFPIRKVKNRILKRSSLRIHEEKPGRKKFKLQNKNFNKKVRRVTCA